ncbi:hypothetical protein OG352_05990 [Streptomyces sp. NBC_01485]|uniref:hypothetical protein n=1 Tax=Streptomyces sp. NBC_01485 TaxID=2903884 RepID=UPI002E30A4CC|nr:hypothetical protein [Streptomyces sp. NBC_01485]
MTTTISSREARLATLLNQIRSQPGQWTAGRLHRRRRASGGPVQRGTARRDLVELERRGHLIGCGPTDGRYYVLRDEVAAR